MLAVGADAVHSVAAALDGFIGALEEPGAAISAGSGPAEQVLDPPDAVDGSAQLFGGIGVEFVFTFVCDCFALVGGLLPAICGALALIGALVSEVGGLFAFQQASLTLVELGLWVVVVVLPHSMMVWR